MRGRSGRTQPGEGTWPARSSWTLKRRRVERASKSQRGEGTGQGKMERNLGSGAEGVAPLAAQTLRGWMARHADLARLRRRKGCG